MLCLAGYSTVQSSINPSSLNWNALPARLYLVGATSQAWAFNWTITASGSDASLPFLTNAFVYAPVDTTVSGPGFNATFVDLTRSLPNQTQTVMPGASWLAGVTLPMTASWSYLADNNGLLSFVKTPSTPFSTVAYAYVATVAPPVLMLEFGPQSCTHLTDVLEF